MRHHSFYERWIGIQNGWRLFLEYPFFGVGLGAYPNYLMNRYLSGDHSFKFIRPPPVGENPLKYFEATNFTVELLASLGIFGLLAFATLLAGIWMRGRTALQREKSVTLSLLLSLFVTLSVLQFNQGIFRSYIWVHFSIVFAYLSPGHFKSRHLLPLESCGIWQGSALNLNQRSGSEAAQLKQ